MVHNLQERIDAITKIPPENLVASDLHGQVASLDTRLKSLEGAITNEDPAKVLSVPLMRRDIENLRSAQAATLAQIDRIYDQNKWFIGLMITMALGIVGLAVGNLFKSGKDSQLSTLPLPLSPPTNRSVLSPPLGGADHLPAINWLLPTSLELVKGRFINIAVHDRDRTRPTTHQSRVHGLPSLIQHAGDKTARRFLEFFTATIRNKNTRRAHSRAVTDFFGWCDSRGLSELARLNPVVVAAYVEQLQDRLSPPSVKRHDGEK